MARREGPVIPPPHSQGPAARYRAAVDSWRDGVLAGAVVDLAVPERPVSVALQAAGRTVAEVGTQAQRFVFDLARLTEGALTELEAALAGAPASLALDARALALRLDGDGPALGVPATAAEALEQIRAARARAAPPAPRIETPRGPRYLAGVDGVTGGVLRGWAVDLVERRQAVALQLEAQGRRLHGFATDEHRPDIGAVLEGNIAGFSLDLASLPTEAAEALGEALAGLDLAAPAPARLIALRIAADGSLIDLGAFGVTVGDLLRGVGKAPPAPEAVDRSRPRAKTGAAPRDAKALHWLLQHFAPAAAEAGPAQRFVAHLVADLERATLVSNAVKRHAADVAPLFDPFHYLDQVAEPEEAIANPLLHYVLAGWREGLSPTPLFAPDYYSRLRGSVAGDPLLDFLREGAALDIDPHPLFDVSFYRERHLNGDRAINPLAHYLAQGGRLRLDPSPLFDSRAFLAAFGLGDETENPLETFVVTPATYDFPLGIAFDAGLYRRQLEIERGETLAEPPYVHYLARGFRDETLLPNLLFDPAFYRERNKLDFTEPALTHYLREGEAAGRSPHPHFSPLFYNQQRGVEGGEGALAHALAHPGEFVSDPRMSAPLDPRFFAFVAGLVEENGEDRFQLEVYRDANPDLGHLDDLTLAAHYRSTGDREGRLASRTRLMRYADMRVRDLPLGLVLDDYTSIYADLARFKDRFLSALFHYGRHGRPEKRLIGKWLFRIADLQLDLPTATAPLRVAAPAERIEVCILIHAFYPDLLPELVAFAQNFREVSFDIFINVVDIAWTAQVQEELRAICPGAFVLLSNDAGRDIGGFTRLLEQVDIARYDFFAFMHSKKSPHIAPESGEYWRRALLSAIAGSPETARECVRLLHDDPRIGMIGAKEWRSHDMGKNVEQYEKLLDLFGVRGKNRELDYLSGFMFLIRADIVARMFEVLRRLDFEYGGDKDLDFHLDGQIAHGVERALPALVRQMGYDIFWR